MFDHNAMAERAALKRAQGGGRRKDGCNKPVSSKAFDDRQGYREMSPWRQLVYRTSLAWRDAAIGAKAGFRQDCYQWERDSVELRCPYVQARKRWGMSDDIPF